MLERLLHWLGLRRTGGASVSKATWQAVESRLPFLDYLQPADRARLRELSLAFLREKEFHGAHGLALTDEMMLEVALQACLPVLNIGLEAYRGWVGIIIYPGEIVVPRHEIDEAGVVHEFEDEVLGEAWEDGPVLLSWQSDPASARANVIIHEFAHKLDMSNGTADGFPPLPATIARSEWAHAFTTAFELLCAQVDAGEPTWIDPYASEHPAEFFAVASEAFFETPEMLEAGFPEIYALLQRFFGLDPLAGWRHLTASGQRFVQRSI